MILLSIAGINPAKKRVFTYFVAKLYIYSLPSLRKRAKLSRNMCHRASLGKSLWTGWKLSYNLARLVKEFCYKKSTMPRKEKKGKDELIMKVMQYFTMVKLKALIPMLSHGDELLWKRWWTVWKEPRRSWRWKTLFWLSSMSPTLHNDKQSKLNFRYCFSKAFIYICLTYCPNNHSKQ